MKNLILLLFSISFSLAVIANETEEAPSYVTSLSWTEETEYSICTINGQEKIRKYKEEIPDEYIFGKYRNPISSTAGVDFYLFPNGKFIIESWCDLCPTLIIAKGDWKINSSKIKIQNLKINKSIKFPYGIDHINEYYGSIENLNLFFTREGNFLGRSLLITDNVLKKDEKPLCDYLIRNEYYRDWEKIQNDLEKKWTSNKPFN